MTSPQASVYTSVAGAIGRIVLNRPDRLNALSTEMVETINATLVKWRDNSRIKAVTIQGNGRAFCAGGDVRAMRDAVLAGDIARNDHFYNVEYATNELIHDYPKPYIALIDGICMGGGIGLSAHGSHRVVTENAVLAMPEVAIGFFPDVGCSYLLPRLPGALGMYVGLTGSSLTPDDACYATLATHRARAADISLIEARLIDADFDVLDDLLGNESLESSILASHREEIDRCFSQPSVLAIIEALAGEKSAWSLAAASTLRRVSPTALCITFSLITCGAELSLSDALRTEHNLGRFVSQLPDFAEGVRASVVDKDRAPNWSPRELESVDVASIEDLVRSAIPAARTAT